MKKLTITLLVALMIPAGFAFGQMQWHDKETGEDVFIMEGKGRCFDGRGMGHGMRGHGPGPHGIMAMAEELELTDDQIDKMQSLATEFRLEKVDKDAAAKKAQIALQALIRDDADEGQVFAAMDKVAQLRADLRKMQYRHHQQMKALLTDEQVEKMKTFRSKRGNVEFMGKQGGRGMKRRIIEYDTDG